MSYQNIHSKSTFLFENILISIDSSNILISNNEVVGILNVNAVFIEKNHFYCVENLDSCSVDIHKFQCLKQLLSSFITFQ